MFLTVIKEDRINPFFSLVFNELILFYFWYGDFVL